MRVRYLALPVAGPKATLLSASGILGLIALWFLLPTLGLVKSAFIPTPVDTLGAFWTMLSDGTLLSDGWPSVRRVLLSVSMSAVVGIPIGIAMGAFGRVEAVLKWIIFPFRTAPIVAFIPIFMLIFGIEEEMKVWFLFFGTVVYIIPLTFDAIRAVPHEYVDAAVDYGFSPLGSLWHFIIPAAWPRIFDAIKVCTGIAWTYLVAAEIINVTDGLGKVVQQAQRFQNTPKVWAGILLILLIGNITDFALGKIRERFFNWEV
ncbi:ABC transporter permease [Haliangium ochraceum]|uniref:Binding-protein-dependent transport systems inner membrane component n=1 Tax=Haliangium ochraceum (strain DSM 14365 / JCM 11303 / SMP-2) TaxID=502025 RepID=D0LVL4_HALO1|nr:ABC transporter permease [Haliangium ochraceum]ACY17575.1 binding-protein-dependent transport systems inner membrane component [Haliangium ochraceum DSM 14365]